MPRHIIILIAVVLLLATWAVEDKTRFVSKGYSNLSLLLAPAFSNESPGSKIPGNGPLAQRDRQFFPVEAAPDDSQELSPFQFAEVLGPNFNKNDLPRTKALFVKVRTVLRNFTRPTAKPAGQPESSPAGGAIQPQKIQSVMASSDKNGTWGHLVAIILANEIPEKADELHGKAKSLAIGRDPAVRPRHESERADKIAASLIAGFLFQEADFLSAFEESKQETRLALGYL